ncbi:TRAM domain-containing protein [Candidatus Woesearchaeota archaeon]|nr:TRAM domain-containing protein [Candidatus Woesearchaeota archaeon]
MNQERVAPVKVGETYEVAIESIGGKGDGVARVKGFVLFVPGVQKGDYVKVRITKVLPSVGFAEVAEKMEKPVRQPKFATVKKEELEQEEETSSERYEDSESFGEE